MTRLAQVGSFLHPRAAALPFVVAALIGPVPRAVAQLDPNAVTLTVPGSAVRCSEVAVVMTSSEAHESASLRTTGVRVVSSLTQKCGYEPGPCQLCRGGPCTSVGEWNPSIGYRGPIHFVFEVTGTSQATFYVDWDDGNVGPPYYRTKTYTMGILTSGTPVVIVISASPTEIPADGRSTSAVSIKVKDQSCRPVPNVAVSLTTDRGSFAGGGTTTTVTTSSAGTATATLVAASSPGTATVTASALGDSASTTVEMKGCQLSFSLNPQVIRADPRASSAITARLVDGAGAVMSGADVTLTTNFSTLTGGGSTGPSLALTTDGAGRATATLQGVATPQRAEITATAACGASASTFVVLSADEDASLGPHLDIPYIADPVHPGIGNYTFSRRLFAFPGKSVPIDFTIYYNSRAAGATGPLGYGWRHSYDTKLSIAADEVVLSWGSGRLDRFLVSGTTYTSLAPQDDVRLTRPDASTYEVRLVGPDLRYLFDASGRLTSILDASGNAVTLTYATRLSRITDTAGRQIDLTYSGSQIASIATPLTAGATARFTYASGDLAGFADARSQNWAFAYDGSHRMLTFTDANGHVALANTYDRDGRLVSQADAFGAVTRFERTAEATGTAVKVTTPDGRVVWHHYDFAFNPIGVADGAGGASAFTYDNRQRRTQLSDKNGRRTSVTYDDQSNITAVTDPLGASRTYTYDGQRRLIGAADAIGRTTTFTWDAQGRLTAVREPSGLTSEATYDAAGLPTTVKGFDGATWSFGYDAQGLMTSRTDPAGATVSFAYDAGGRVTQITPPGGTGTERFTYDAGGLLTSATDPLGHVTSYARDANGNVASVTFQPLAATTTFAYDEGHRPVAITDPLGGVTRFTYDLAGNLRTETDPDGVRFVFEYDGANRLVAKTDALGGRTQFGYDASGNLTSLRDAMGRTWRTTFDAASRPVEDVDPLGHRSQLTFDAIGRLASVRDPLGRTTSTAYDTAGRPVAVTSADGTVLRRTFDGEGRQLTFSDGGGRTWRWAYDAVGRVAKLTDPAAHDTTTEYDALGRATRTRLRSGRQVEMRYDAASRLTRVTGAGLGTVDYAYDANGALTSVADPTGTTSMTRDTLGRVLTLRDPLGAAVGFTYTAAGRMASVVYPGNLAVAYKYDGAGRLATITDWLGHVTRFDYEASGRVVTARLPNGTRTEYGYDAAGRLVTLTHRASSGGVLHAIALALDGNDRVIRAARTAPSHAVTPPVAAAHAYDEANRLTASARAGVTSTFTSDLDGSLTTLTAGTTATTFGYDALRQLRSVTGGGSGATYAYDGRGLRVSKTIDGITTRYLRDEQRVYCLLDAAGAVSRYLIGAGQLIYSLGVGGDVRVYHGDERGSVVAVTDGTGAVVRSYAYGPYGEVVGSAGGVANEFQYLGLHWVMADENGLLHMNARYYSPMARRFLTEDPIGIAGGANVYAYAEGDPVNRIDPSGLQPPPAWHPQLAKALEFFLTKGFEAGYRNAGYLVPQNAVKLGQIYLDSQTVTEYLAATRTTNQMIYQSAMDFQAAYGGGTTVSTSWTTAGNIGQGSVIQSNTISLAKPTTGNFATQIGKWSPANRAFTVTTETVAESTVTWSTRVARVAGRVGKVLGPLGWVVSAGLEGWDKGRQVGESALVWDPGQGRWITVDESHQWIYNQYNGWVDQPEMFDYIEPEAYVAWQQKRYGDGTNRGSKGDASLLQGVSGGNPR